MLREPAGDNITAPVLDAVYGKAIGEATVRQVIQNVNRESVNNNVLYTPMSQKPDEERGAKRFDGSDPDGKKRKEWSCTFDVTC